MESNEQTAVEPAVAVGFAFDNSYARLPERFFARVRPATVPGPRLIRVNDALARRLGADPEALRSPDGVEMLAGNRIAEGSEPLAQAYAGHQFGNFVPQLGDGRANLLGEVVGTDGLRYDVQLKGSGRTPFSRGGDGKAAMGPVLREYIVSEAMAALGVPTTRALAAVATGETVFRETPLPGAVLTRVAASHLRVGTFEYFAARRDVDGIRTLADTAILRHYPAAAQADRRYRALLDGVVERQARLVAEWMMLGFIHGVMNTDNTSISGETIDYGPCAFMEAYDPATVFSAIDRMGRYAYGNQPAIMLWNLTRFAEALLPAIALESEDEKAAVQSATESLEAFAGIYQAARWAKLRQKLGLMQEMEGDTALAEDLLARMLTGKADFTLTFRKLCDAAAGQEGDAGVRALFEDGEVYDTWVAVWRRRLAEEDVPAHERAAAMRRVNPAFIPRNHRVEAALKAGIERQDFGPFEQMLEVGSRPFEDRQEFAEFMLPAKPEERVCQTFCGT